MGKKYIYFRVVHRRKTYYFILFSFLWLILIQKTLPFSVNTRISKIRFSLSNFYCWFETKKDVAFCLTFLRLQCSLFFLTKLSFVTEKFLNEDNINSQTSCKKIRKYWKIAENCRVVFIFIIWKLWELKQFFRQTGPWDV